ncbi:class A beta-lactamase-related serine hydrolase [Gramella sp. BOM4]|nr:class A beta-lactamase-related serine hydrolase [Christiangramia bathymodioli]
MKIKSLIATVFLYLQAGIGYTQLQYSKIDSIIEHHVKNKSFEGTILIADSSEITYNRSFGFKDLNREERIDDHTRFSIASITKMFTSIVILQLIEENRLELSENLEQLLSTYEIPNSELITVHHLLIHISGLPNESDSIYHKRVEPEEFIATSVLNKPNQINSFNYNNLDYILLGKIIERIENTTWQESVQNRMLDKIGMKETGFLKHSKKPENFANSFNIDANDIRKQDRDWYYENYYAAGSMYSSAIDLFKFHRALDGDELLNSESKSILEKSYPEYNYAGYGVWNYKYPFLKSQPRLMERRGAILGSNSVIVRFLDQDKCIIILSNNNKFNPDTFGNQENLKEALIREIGKTSR